MSPLAFAALQRLLWPVRSRAQGEQLRAVLDAYLRDTANAHLLQADGSYQRPEGQPVFDSQVWLLRHAATLLQAHAGVFAPSNGP